MIKGLSTVKTIKVKNGTILLFTTDHGCLARLNHLDFDDDVDWCVHGNDAKDALYNLVMLCNVVFTAFREQWKIGNITVTQLNKVTEPYIVLKQEILWIIHNMK